MAVAICLDMPPDKSTAKWVSGFVADGLIVERLPNEKAQAIFGRCKCEKEPEPQASLFDLAVAGEK
jgi:hypothetical protein